MRRFVKHVCAAVSLGLLSSFLCGCGGGGSGSGGKSAEANHQEGVTRETNTDFLVPEASGTTVLGSGDVSVDASHIDQGYVMVKYTGSADKMKLQITTPDSTVYTYNLVIGDYQTFTFSGGSGSYHLDLLEHAFDEMYALVDSEDLSVELSDEFLPFLYPNQYVWYTKDNNAVALAQELSGQSSNDLDYVTQVYNYVIENIDYDEELAANVESDYIPDIDRTLETKKGICFDYASLMAAMLRCQNIPTKLVVGYSGQAYHAWISVYLKEVGWVDNIIEFDGKDWSLMDPTLAAGNSSESVKKYVGDGSNYTVKYSY